MQTGQLGENQIGCIFFGQHYKLFYIPKNLVSQVKDAWEQRFANHSGCNPPRRYFQDAKPLFVTLVNQKIKQGHLIAQLVHRRFVTYSLKTTVTTVLQDADRSDNLKNAILLYWFYFLEYTEQLVFYFFSC